MLQFVYCSEFIREGMNIVDIITEPIAGLPTKISFKENRIVLIPANYFPITAIMTTDLDLSDNEISILEPGSLSMLVNLEIINLDQNQLTVVKTFMFNDLNNLKELFLNRNSIHTLESRCFASLVELEKLGIKHNNLTILPADIFNLEAHPTHLDLRMKDNPFQCSWQMCWIKLNEHYDHDDETNSDRWIHIYGEQETFCKELTSPFSSHKWSALSESDLDCHLYTTPNGK